MLAFALVFCHSISLKSLQSAIGNPQLMQPIGSKYHRVALNGEELAVAIKIIELRPSDVSQPVRSRAHKRRVQHELELLARLKHRNVMSLRAYVCDIERLLLVYDYIAGGSLEDAMVRVRVREQQLALGWDARHQIAVGIAKGLRYLHFECSRRILHCSLTP